MLFYMARRLLKPTPDNATLHELKNTARIGSGETSLRCSAIQMLLVDVPREQVCNALLVSERSLRTWINLFNEKGIDGLIVNKRPGRTAIINGEQTEQLTLLIEQPEAANRDFWTAKAFHGFISEGGCVHLLLQRTRNRA